MPAAALAVLAVDCAALAADWASPAFVLAVLIVGEQQPLVAWCGLGLVMLGLMGVIRAELRPTAFRAPRESAAA